MGREDFDPLATARSLMLAGRIASLATLRPDGAPYVSLVEIAPQASGAPLTLISRLALHTQNLGRDSRAAILIDERGRGDPLRQARLTLSGRLEPTTDDAAKRRYLRAHPQAEKYAGFADFEFWRMVVEIGNLVAGFGRIVELPGRDLLPADDRAEE